MAGLNTTIQCFRGFTEHAYRLVYPYGTAFPDREPELLTILPNGTVENRKVLEPKQGKGLLAYPYIQTIAPTLATEHLETPFVREREDGTLALVQAWSTNYNDSFREQYDIHEENPNTSIFSLQAAQQFQETLKALFGPATDEPCAPRMLYCHRASENNLPVFLGTTEELLAFLEGNPQQMAEMGVVRLFEDGFETRVFCNDGKKKDNKTFKMAPGQRHALYTKNGNCKMACVTPEEQFMHDRNLFKEIPLDGEEEEEQPCDEDDASTDPFEGVDEIGNLNMHVLPTVVTQLEDPLERADAFIACKAAGDKHEENYVDILPQVTRSFTDGGTAPVGEHPNLPINPDNGAVLRRVKPFGKRDASEAEMSPTPVHVACKLVRTKNSKQCGNVRASLAAAAERNMHVDTGK